MINILNDNGQLPFEGDAFIRVELIKLRDKFNLINCVETGTQYGNTTKDLCNIFNNVSTVEADNDYYEFAKANLKHYKLEYIWFGLSIEFLKEDVLKNDTLFYLDAHGCKVGGCPLKQELEIIASKKLKNICIVIHDFKVPSHPELGYDSYDYDLKFEEIELYLHDIYPNGFDYHYNSEANGAMRGIIYIYPKKMI